MDGNNFEVLVINLSFNLYHVWKRAVFSLLEEI